MLRQASCSSSIDDSDKLSLDSSTFPASERGDPSNNPGERESLVHNSDDMADTARVARWRTVVILMLTVTATLVVSSVYVVLSRDEEEDFKESFVQSAQTIQDATMQSFVNVFRSLSSLSDVITSEAETLSQSWPNISLNHFEIKGAHARLDAQAEIMALAVLVSHSERAAWEAYSVANQAWLDQSEELAEETSTWFSSSEHETTPTNSRQLDEVDDSSIVPWLHNAELGVDVPAPEAEVYLPLWHISPPPIYRSVINYDFLSDPLLQTLLTSLISKSSDDDTADAVFSDFVVAPSLSSPVLGDSHWDLHAPHHDQGYGDDHTADDHPHSIAVLPVRKGFQDDSVVGVLGAYLPWDRYLVGLLPPAVVGVYAVVQSTCSNAEEATHHSYLVNGPHVIYQGPGDLHEAGFEAMGVHVDLTKGLTDTSLDGACDYTLHIYPSSVYKDGYVSSKPTMFTLAVAAVFLATGLVFYVFVRYVQRRQLKVMDTALRSTAIISSLFPKQVRDRLMNSAGAQMEREKSSKGFPQHVMGPRHTLKDFLENDGEEHGSGNGNVFDTKPIADLFPETTIMFADIVGFTAWSSVREPSQVFTLLETVYHAFDEIAGRRRVFKVETVGDCYVAVAGLPDPRRDHAVVMARFATECHSRLVRLVKELETTLGPDTGELSMRFGLHSGPVTAGVLRGERARFQLFGDTVNTAARMESNGMRARIHASEDTAKLLMASGKSHWLKARPDRIMAKGKGELQTYWVHVKGSMTTTSTSSSMSMTEDREEDPLEPSLHRRELIESSRHIQTDGDVEVLQLGAKTLRLIDWNVDLLLRLLRQITARRLAKGEPVSGTDEHRMNRPAGATVLDEVKEIIKLPKFDENALKNDVDPDAVEVGDELKSEIRNFVTTIAMLYRENPFHNFEHASHVAMSAIKLLSRIIAPSNISMDQKITDEKWGDRNSFKKKLASTLHDHTYGITSDPLTQFACVFSALIHDVDHTGVPNSQLIKENATVANLYKKKSVAEQNSVDLAWDLLMDDRYVNFRKAIYSTESEFQRFRQLVVNSVMATDIMDKDLKALRNARWDKAFTENSTAGEARIDNVNRKATIVIEHLIQASDVAHTMQHWHIYTKWNERLFEEMYVAFKTGRAEKDPSANWYQGELGFFDFYIIPLAKKLKDCGVFGVSSYEYLNYAEHNRREWEAKGSEVVAAVKMRVETKLAKQRPTLGKRRTSPKKLAAEPKKASSKTDMNLSHISEEFFPEEDRSQNSS